MRIILSRRQNQAEDLSPSTRGARKSERFQDSPGASEDRRKVPVPFQHSVDPGAILPVCCIHTTSHRIGCHYGAPHVTMVQTSRAGVLCGYNKLAARRGGLEPRCASAMVQSYRYQSRWQPALDLLALRNRRFTQHPIPCQGIPSHRMHGA
jgi:hypothetical protein